MVAFLAWLVREDVFVEAAFFCMMKGHTFTVLDQRLPADPVSALQWKFVFELFAFCLGMCVPNSHSAG
eukprot:5461961-Pleurochrysis_carterae.AAC.1